MSRKLHTSPSDVDIWMPLYIDKWIAAVTTLDRADTGSYLQAILYHWKYGPLPANLEQVCRIMKIDIGDASSIPQASPKHPFSIALALLRKYFVELEDGTWSQTSNRRIKDEWQAKRIVFNERARNAALARWGKRDASSMPQALLEDMLEECPVSVPLQEVQIQPLTSFGVSALGAAPAIEPETPKIEAPPKSPRSDRKGGQVGNGAKVEAARARTRGYEGKKPHPMLKDRPSKATDPRISTFKAEIMGWYRDVNEGREGPWGPVEEKALSAMLEASPMDLHDLKQCLEHRAVSVGAREYSSSLMPGVWLRKLPGFLAVPLNRYGDPLPSNRKPLG